MNLRAYVRGCMEDSVLIRRCAKGDLAAARAMSLGFWPFVFNFQEAIGERVAAHLPLEPLYERFGRGITRKTLIETKRKLKILSKSEVDGVFSQAEQALMGMQHEELTHSFHWRADARNLGISHDELNAASALLGVQVLVERVRCDDLVEFFARSLAATEFITEELGAKLAHCDAYTRLFGRKRAIWMEVHTIPHDDGLSHGDIVLGLARAYDTSSTSERIETLVKQGIDDFAAAARDVAETYNISD